MQKRLIPILLVCMLITGCAQTPSENIVPSNTESSASETVETTVSDAAESDSSEESTISPDSTDAVDSTEEESNILTFEATTVYGETLSSDCFADSKLTMINIWATYCNPCLVELPFLGSLVDEYEKSDFQIIGIVSDVYDYDNSVDYDAVTAMIEDCSADNFPHLIVNRDLTLKLITYINAVPTTFFVNQEGEILGYVVGSKHKEDWIEIIDELLAEME